MKEFWTYLSRSFDHADKVFGRIKKTKTFDAYEEAVALAFSGNQWLGSGNS
jgi:hypothetical protein